MALMTPPRLRGKHTTVNFAPADGCLQISGPQLAYMLDGIDWRNPQRTFRPELAG